MYWITREIRTGRAGDIARPKNNPQVQRRSVNADFILNAVICAAVASALKTLS